ncbi:hypothetical protein KKE19_01420 [Patescibacteria group bacterium]|nr:hypothetical protein [Patescibacteria group bacterium]MBU4368031.1 hypothetical protein [Patescibacteria group bacterium]MBU4462202.1 hypothetical protein [Patescibacteria group bacterium]MCG2699558.1 hypothetical protein [Candidatus Parcubacteria bacterium]
MTEEITPLTPEQKEKIWRAISDRTLPDDRDPQEIIAEDYNGDEDRYLRVMANWHNMKLD